MGVPNFGGHMLNVHRNLIVALVTMVSLSSVAQSLACRSFYTGVETRLVSQKAISTLQSFKDSKTFSDVIDSQFAKSQIGARLNPPIQMSFEAASFRREWLPKITTDKSKREQIMRLVEAELRLSSVSTLESIKKKRSYV